MVVESKDTAEFLNDYFTGIGPQLARAFDNTRYTQGERVPHRMNNITTNIDEVVIVLTVS